MNPLTEQFRPRRLADIRGQPAAVRLLTGKLRLRKSFAVIASGKPGIGKTSLAYAIAGELGVNADDATSGFRLVPSNRQGVEELAELFNGCHCAPLAGGWWVLCLEECEIKSRQAVNFLKTRLENLPPKTVVVFTTNASIDDATDEAVAERCLCLTFEHDAGKLWDDAQKLVSHAWETVLGHNHSPSLEDLGFSRAGRLSFRQVLNALEPVLLAELPPEPAVEPSAPVDTTAETEPLTVAVDVAPLVSDPEPEPAVDHCGQCGKACAVGSLRDGLCAICDLARQRREVRITTRGAVQWDDDIGAWAVTLFAEDGGRVGVVSESEYKKRGGDTALRAGGFMVSLPENLESAA